MELVGATDRLAGQTHDLVGAVAVGGGEHDPGPPNRLACAVAIVHNRLEPDPVGRAHEKADVIAFHAPSLVDCQADRGSLLGGKHQ